MNRLAVGLAVGAGYVLGRTKKAKFAFAVGTMVAGKRLQLSPRALVTAVTQQLENNPQFKEIGDQLREDLRGVGKAATGSLVNRQMEGLADRLHERTLGVQDRLSGVLPGDAEEKDEGPEGAAPEAEADAEADDSRRTGRDEEPSGRDEEPSGRDEEPSGRDEEPSGRDEEPSGRDEEPRRQSKKAAAKKAAPPKSSARSAKPSARSAAKPPAKKSPAKKSAQPKAAQKKTAAAARGTARRASSTARADRPEGGRDDG
ncbi:DNA primase [Streptomyces arenae]|nr:DNA primase [Streptomyces arenae]